MRCGAHAHESIARDCVAGFIATGWRVDGCELAGTCWVRPAISRRAERCAFACSLVGYGRGWARPLRAGSLRDENFVAAGAGGGIAFYVDGCAGRWCVWLFRRSVGASGDGGDGFIFVAALVV